MVRFVLAASLFMLLALAGAPAHAVRSGTIGMAEGEPSQAMCPNKTYLAGFAAQYDVVLSGLQPYCVAMASDGGWEGGAQIHLDIAMSEAIMGGRRLDFFCPRDFYMFRVRGHSHVYGIHSIMQITLTCLNVKTGGMTAFATQPNGASLTEWPEVACPDTTVANGVVGMINSARIIQFGFSCAQTRPAFMMSQMVTAKPTSAAKLLTKRDPKTYEVTPSDTFKGAVLATPKAGATGALQQMPADSAIISAPASDTGIKAVTTTKYGSYKDQIAAVPDVPVDPAPAPAPTPAPASQPYAPPLTQAGFRLYACQTVGGGTCGKPVADTFCQQQGFMQANTFNTATEKGQAQTLAGEKCTKKKCKMFTQIVCVR